VVIGPIATAPRIMSDLPMTCFPSRWLGSDPTASAFKQSAVAGSQSPPVASVGAVIAVDLK